MSATTNAPTPLGIAHRHRRPLTSTAAGASTRPPLAALVMRVAFDRVVLWTVCIDDGAELTAMSGKVDMLPHDPDHAPAAAFTLAAVHVLPEVAGALRAAAAASPSGFIELAVPNSTLRAVTQQVADGLGPAQVLASNDIVRLAAVERAVADADAMYAELLAGKVAQDSTAKASKQPVDVEVATDASVRRGKAPAGAAWVRADGMFATSIVDTSDIAVAELTAIAMAIGAHAHHTGGLTVKSDSREALAMAGSALRGDVDSWSAAARRRQRRIVDSPIRSAVKLQWVKGHRGNALNEAADALAVMARRHHDAGVSPSEHRVRARNEVFDMLGCTPQGAPA